MNDHEKEALQCIFDRPTEYIFMPKGKGNSIVFSVPDAYVKEEFRSLRNGIVKKLTKKGCKYVPVENITLPDLTIAKKMGLKEPLSLFLTKHLECADSLVGIFMEARTVKDLISVAAYCHDRVNPYLFHYSLSVALLHREDTKQVQLPNYAQVFPAQFIPSAAFGQARQAAAVIPLANRIPIDLSKESTANPNEPEQAIAYFREDIGINLHHWHWHLVYPQRGATDAIVRKDRRGELFYYMHQQIIARYNTERISNGLQKVKTLSNLREVIPQGYFPKLDMLVASRSWPPRPANMTLKDINRDDQTLVITINQIEGWMTLIRTAIQNGFITDPTGKRISLDGFDGIDILGNLVEASSISLNRDTYGNMHNMGHIIIAYVHDPDGRFNEPAAVMGSTATAMRDPIFYRWHEYVNSVFVLHKDKLPKYSVAQLSFPQVLVTDVQVTTSYRPANQLITHWQRSDIDISRGLDFAPRSPVSFRFTHLQHEDFTFAVDVTNNTTQQLLGTMRLFMAQKNHPNGVALTFNEQRVMMIELDKFRVTLRPGKNKIIRKSLDSSVTIPYDRTFRNLDENRPPDNNPSLYQFNFCGCGWPDHMLIPRGTSAGMAFDLFAMVSDYTKDTTNQTVTGICDDASSYCGIQDKLYPDRQSMGFPFDRVGRDGVTSLTSFLTPNMKIRTITVKFENRTVIKNQAPSISVVKPYP